MATVCFRQNNVTVTPCIDHLYNNLYAQLYGWRPHAVRNWTIS